MKYWAQYYRKSATGYVEACGSDQVADMDGRHNHDSMLRVATEIGKQRKFDGFRIARGSSYSKPFFINAAVQEL